MEENGNVVRGHNAGKASEISKESPGMGEVMKPTGLPDHVKCLVVTFDTKNNNINIAGLVEDGKLSIYMLAKALELVVVQCPFLPDQQSEFKKI